MKSISRFLLFALTLISVGAHASPVATTAGSNLTAYNSGFGATNNNNWNTLTNPRTGADSAPTADFGNCNALILRCAQPKCKSGGCTDMDVTSAIVTGCVNSNDTCKQYGAELVNYISAQLVAQSTAKANQASAAAASQETNQQMAQLQQTITALQQQVTESNANMQAALDAQQQSIASQIASAATSSAPVSSGGGTTAPAPTSGGASTVTDSTELTSTQRVAAESGVSEDLILREQISGEILSKIEAAEKSLETLEQTMSTAFGYAGCDKRGDNCTGPKRVKKFKELANEFFDPYEDVLDDLYEAILLSQSVGVDVSNIYMMLNNSCERWAKYACSKPMTTIVDPNDSNKNLYTWPRYNELNCVGGKSVPGAPIVACKKYEIETVDGVKNRVCKEWGSGLGSVRGNQECHDGQTIPPEDDTSCTMIEILSGNSEDKVARGYLYPDEGDMGDMVRVGCASNALKGSWLFRGKKQQASINIDTLRRIIEQDNSEIGFARSHKNDLGQREQVKYCALTEPGYMNLQKYVGLRGLPTTNICINDRTLDKNMDRAYIGESDSIIAIARNACLEKTGAPQFSERLFSCFCYKKDINNRNVPATGVGDDKCDQTASQEELGNAEGRICRQYGAVYSGGNCDCTRAYPEDRDLCETRFMRPSTLNAPTPNTVTPFVPRVSGSGGLYGNDNNFNNFMSAANQCSDAGGSYENGVCKCMFVSFNSACCKCSGGLIIDKPGRNPLQCLNVQC